MKCPVNPLGHCNEEFKDVADVYLHITNNHNVREVATSFLMHMNHCKGEN